MMIIVHTKVVSLIIYVYTIKLVGMLLLGNKYNFYIVSILIPKVFRLPSVVLCLDCF